MKRLLVLLLFCGCQEGCPTGSEINQFALQCAQACKPQLVVKVSWNDCECQAEVRK
jgi:hypothetical protein